MSESQTPRTDAEIASQDPYWFGRVKGEFSRQLELRCALWKRAAKAQRWDAKKAVRQRIATEDCLTERYRKDQSKIKQLERELNEAKAKLDFLKSKGLTVSLMKTSDKPESYLVYVIEPGSELSDTKTINDLVDSESRLKIATEALEDIRDNWDHDACAHKYGTPCRCCSATEALNQIKK